jgi:catechol 2,3-dioxygenase-like lactoylglutathione lyase family enzyme
VDDARKPELDQLNLITANIDAMVAFYRRLGLTVEDSGDDWPPGSGARHVEIAMSNELSLELDNATSASTWHGAVRERGATPATVVFGFALPTREAVDERYAELTASGAIGRQEPYDAFWGARYAIVTDPDGHDIGLMSQKDPARRVSPPP